MNYEQLVVELTRIKKELEDVRASTDVDYITVGILNAYLRHATTNLICMVDFLEYKIKELKGGAK